MTNMEIDTIKFLNKQIIKMSKDCSLLMKNRRSLLDRCDHKDALNNTLIKNGICKLCGKLVH